MVISKVVNYFLMSQLTFSQSFWSFLIITGLSEQHQLLTGPDGGPNAYYTSFDAYILGSFSSYSIFDNFSVSYSEKLPKFKKEHQKIYRETRSIAVIEIVWLLFEIKFETVGLIFALYIKATRGDGMQLYIERNPGTKGNCIERLELLLHQISSGQQRAGK